MTETWRQQQPTEETRRLKQPTTEGTGADDKAGPTATDKAVNESVTDTDVRDTATDDVAGEVTAAEKPPRSGDAGTGIKGPTETGAGGRTGAGKLITQKQTREIHNPTHSHCRLVHTLTLGQVPSESCFGHVRYPPHVGS